MNKKACKNIIILTVFITGILLMSAKVYAAPNTTLPIPDISISLDNSSSPTQYVDNVKLLVLLTVLTLLPSFIMMMTSFIRLVVVFGFLRSAIGTQQSPPNQVLIGLALFLTVLIMMPVYKEMDKTAIQPYLNNQITQAQFVENGSKPLREFMLKQTREKDLKLFVDAAKVDYTVTKDNAPLYMVVPAYIISELKTAFQIGFLLYIPFLIIDLVVASVLMSMGMFMLSPPMISLPFKLLLFVMVDGWYLLVKSLILSFS